MSTLPVNETEEFVFGVCRNSFLRLWCYNNPIGKGGKELCDILVICEPHIVIVSVKDVKMKDTQNPEIDHDRWERRAVDESVKQIYGAERWLGNASHIIRSDGTPGLGVPAEADRRMHRIAVAFGGGGEATIKSGDFGKGFVHVMSEHSFVEVMGELDTVTDLVEYLAAKEALVARGCSVVVQGSESNLLGWYLANQRAFPTDANFMIVDDTIWRGLSSSSEFLRRKEADRESYVWDKLVDLLSDPDSKQIGEAGAGLSDAELALRAMARENRFHRRILGVGVREFLVHSTDGRLRSRILVGPSGVIYVLVFFGSGEDAEHRIAELGARCFCARHKHGSGSIVIGVGIGKYAPGSGSTSDLIYLNLADWSSTDAETAVKMTEGLGFFRDSASRHSHEDEYPV